MEANNLFDMGPPSFSVETKYKLILILSYFIFIFIYDFISNQGACLHSLVWILMILKLVKLIV